MFKTILGNKVFTVTWVHDVEHRQTMCFIESPNGQIYTGFARVHPEDKYVKAIGRKVSLAKALQNITSNKNIRKFFWDEYKKRCKLN